MDALEESLINRVSAKLETCAGHSVNKKAGHQMQYALHEERA